MRGPCVLVGLLLAPSLASGAPIRLPVQGELTDAAGQPIDGQLRVSFRVLGEPYLAATAYEETLLVTFVQGDFTVSLGENGLLDSDVFRLDQQLWLSIQVDGDQPMDPLPIGTAPLAAFSEHARDAETLDGWGSADFLPATWRPAWTDIQGRPPGLDDGDNVSAAPGGGVVYGEDFELDGDVLSLAPGLVEQRAQAVCYNTPDELLATLDGVWLPQGWTPTWADLRDVPPGFADGSDDGATPQAGQGLWLDGDVLALDTQVVEELARDVCFNTEGELRLVLDDDYRSSTWQPDWAEIRNVPPYVLVSDAIIYEAGDGLILNGVRFDLDIGFVDERARAVCFDSEAELRGMLDNDYLPASWRAGFFTLDGLPAGFADGIDDDTLYAAGDGLLLDEEVLSVDPAWVGLLAGAVCYNEPAELTALLDPRYRSVSWVPVWSDVDEIPAGFADGVDDDAFAWVSCPEGQSLIWLGAGWSCADLRDNPLDAQDLAAMLDGADVDFGPGTTVGGVPLTSSVYTDENAVEAVRTAFPELANWERHPLVQMGLNTELCDHSATSAFGGILKFETLFSGEPSFVATLDQSTGASGASWVSIRRIGTDRVVLECNAPSDGLAWMAVDRGRHQIDGRAVEVGRDVSALNNEMIEFSIPFPAPPVVLLKAEGAQWARLIGSVTADAFQVALSVGDHPLHWIAMEPGEYHYGRYHWVAARVVDPDNNDRFPLGTTFHSLPSVLMTPEDTNNSGGSFTRMIDATTTDFQLYIDGSGSEYLHFVAFEEDR